MFNTVAEGCGGGDKLKTHKQVMERKTRECSKRKEINCYANAFFKTESETNTKPPKEAQFTK